MTAIFGIISKHPTLSGYTVGVYFEGNTSFLSAVGCDRDQSVQSLRSAESCSDAHIALLQYIQNPTGIMGDYDAAGWDTIVYDISPQVAQRLRKTIVKNSPMSEALSYLQDDDEPLLQPDAETVYYGIGGQTP